MVRIRDFTRTTRIKSGKRVGILWQAMQGRRSPPYVYFLQRNFSGALETMETIAFVSILLIYYRSSSFLFYFSGNEMLFLLFLQIFFTNPSKIKTNCSFNRKREYSISFIKRIYVYLFVSFIVGKF